MENPELRKIKKFQNHALQKCDFLECVEDIGIHKEMNKFWEYFAINFIYNENRICSFLLLSLRYEK